MTAYALLKNSIAYKKTLNLTKEQMEVEKASLTKKTNVFFSFNQLSVPEYEEIMTLIATM